jgi:hypothetical protein
MPFIVDGKRVYNRLTNKFTIENQLEKTCKEVKKILVEKTPE